MIVEYEDNERNRKLDRSIKECQDNMVSLVKEYGFKALEYDLYKGYTQIAVDCYNTKTNMRIVLTKEETKNLNLQGMLLSQ